MIFPDYANLAVRLLQESGFEAYFVGGCVRDRLLQRDCHDIDITTSATPREMKTVFSRFPVVETGLRHGTLTVLFDRVPVEITTFRTETAYSDGRHPDAIRFTRSLREDLARRDFTVNAMAYSPKSGLIDPFGGQADLQRKLLRCVGNGEERFTEDALRILRLLRFASVLGFSVDKETKKAAYVCKDRLTLLSKERIAAECKGLLCGEYVRNVLCEDWEILAVVFPFLEKMHGFDQHNFHHCYDLLEHTAAVTAAAPPTNTLRLAAFFHDCGKPDCFSIDAGGVGHFYGHAARSAEIAAQLLEELKLDRKTAERVVQLVKLHDSPIEARERTVKRKLNKYGEEMLLELIALQRADTLGLAPQFHARLSHFDRLEALTQSVLASGAAFSVGDLAVNGNDLKALGLEGKAIGDALNMLTEAVIDGKAENRRTALLDYFSSRS